jgi:protein-tyrosine phosphatase
MAETLLREQIRQKLGSEDKVRVLSAGVAAGAGSGASPQAVEVMGSRDLDLTGHSSRPLDDAVMNVADLILTMTRGHRAAILAAWPNMEDRVHTLRRDGGDITDPVGMPVEVCNLARSRSIRSCQHGWKLWAMIFSLSTPQVTSEVKDAESNDCK